MALWQALLAKNLQSGRRGRLPGTGLLQPHQVRPHFFQADAVLQQAFHGGLLVG
jgi:hypothetical protein